LTACISEAERENGNEDLRKGKILIKEYVRETYGKKAKASDYETCYIRRDTGSTVPNFDKVSSGYVKATVSTDDEQFDILYNVYTNEVLSKENIDAIKESFCSYVNDEVLQIDNFNNIDMTIYSLNISDPDISGYIEPSITNYRDLISSRNYTMELTFRYVDSDFDSITDEKWRKIIYSFIRDGVDLIFVNYKDKESYEAQKDENYYNYIDSQTPYYETEEASTYTKDIIYINTSGDIQEYKGLGE
jgi:hypothetical protein